MQQSADDNLAWLGFFLEQRVLSAKQAQRGLWKRLEVGDELPQELEELAFEPYVFADQLEGALPCDDDRTTKELAHVARLLNDETWSTGDAGDEVAYIVGKTPSRWTSEQRNRAMAWGGSSWGQHDEQILAFLQPYLALWNEKLALFTDDEATP